MAQTNNGGAVRPMRYVRLITREDVILTGDKVQLIEDYNDRTVTQELTIYDMVREEQIGGLYYRWYAAGGMVRTESEAEGQYGW